MTGLSEADAQECATLFKLFDADKSNSIDIGEFSTLCRGMGAAITNARLKTIFEESDADKDGALSLEELQAAYKTIKDEEPTDDMLVELSKIFRTLDKQGKGYLDLEEFKKLLTSKGEPLSDEEVAEVFASTDTSGDGKIDLDEFLVMNGVDPPPKPTEEATGEGEAAEEAKTAEADAEKPATEEAGGEAPPAAEEGEAAKEPPPAADEGGKEEAAPAEGQAEETAKQPEADAAEKPADA